MGHIVLNENKTGWSSWSLVDLGTDSPLENTVSIPGGCGESFVLTRAAKLMPDGFVWIVTKSVEILYGQSQTFGDDGTAVDHQWTVHTFSYLSEHYITYDDKAKTKF